MLAGLREWHGNTCARFMSGSIAKMNSWNPARYTVFFELYWTVIRIWCLLTFFVFYTAPESSLSFRLDKRHVMEFWVKGIGRVYC